MNKILVTFATRAGSTYEVAARVAEVLRAGGATVEVKPVTAVHEVKDYDAVVVGSAIRMGHWLPEAVGVFQNKPPTPSRIPTPHLPVSGVVRNDTPRTPRPGPAFLYP